MPLPASTSSLGLTINHIHVYGIQSEPHPFGGRTDAPLIYQGSEGVSFGGDTQDERRADVLLEWLAWA